MARSFISSGKSNLSYRNSEQSLFNGNPDILTSGDAALIQRCQVHKIRNMASYLPEAKRHAVKFRMRAAYQMQEAADACKAMYKLHDELIQENPSAAGRGTG